MQATYEDDFEEHLLVNLEELLVPFVNLARALAGIVFFFGGDGWVGFVVVAPLQDLFENAFCNL